MNRNVLVHALDTYLRVHEIEDQSMNGLQVEGPAEIQRVAFAVDSSLAGFQKAVAQSADLLIVHHGLFWGKERALVGPFYQRIRTLVTGNLGLYAAHLPLDMHEEVGNNVQLARALNLEVAGPFQDRRGTAIGVIARPSAGPLDREALRNRVNSRLETQSVVQWYGTAQVQTVGIVSGGAASMIGLAAQQGCDLFLTGETNHNYAHDAPEYGMNVVFAGHYATETVGLKALAHWIEEKFMLETFFIDLPTGM